MLFCDPPKLKMIPNLIIHLLKVVTDNFFPIYYARYYTFTKVYPNKFEKQVDLHRISDQYSLFT